jgi:hypothetical protein
MVCQECYWWAHKILEIVIVKSMVLEEPFFQSKRYQLIGSSSRRRSILCVDWVVAADAGGFPCCFILGT